MPPVALTIAGSDPSGGAGIQADLKTFHRFGVYGQAVITLITVQNTKAVLRVETLSPDLVLEQIRAVVSDIPPNAAKTGALGTAEIIEALAEAAVSFTFPLVVDPVMISKHGARLVSANAEQVLKEKLLPRAFLVTPNIPEAEALTGMTICSEKDMALAAERLLDFGCKAALVKGGHLQGDPVDVLGWAGTHCSFRGSRVNTPHTHGTGCTYSAAITAGLARNKDLSEAISEAKQFVQRAIEQAPGLGRGIGPLNHMA
ncbi:MAG TPA: bifunctional hydroxymethylpyrimidine kinase/phosphomethylpyrimidine kinase [Bryobacteraceae bacterium]|jgi:hydroxymethylpyrimidine/phosphomethylpyrimidine kinase